jgi:GNAT superfamily N-acetyltransferase
MVAGYGLSVTTLADILTAASRGHMPRPGAGPTIVPQPSLRDAGVIAFTGHSVIFADLDEGWFRSRLSKDDLSAPLNPPFLSALEERMNRRVNNIDMLALASPCRGRPPIPLTEVMTADHPRIERARRYRDDIRVWTCPGGILIIGRGVAGRWEVAIEVDPAHQGRGMGRTLARASRHLSAHPLWAQIAPGNAASVRSFLAAGYVPMGAEALLTPMRTKSEG